MASQQVSLIFSSLTAAGFQIHCQKYMENSKYQTIRSSQGVPLLYLLPIYEVYFNLDMFIYCHYVCSTTGDGSNDIPLNPLLPKITMVGISMGDGGQVSRASLKKTMEDLTKELEQASQKSTELDEDKDPLFVANVGDYSTITRMASS